MRKALDKRSAIGLIAIELAAIGMCAMTGCASHTKTTEKGSGGPGVAERASATDPYLWLEDVESAKSLEWVRAHNAKSEAAIETTPAYKDMKGDIRKILLAPDRLPMGSMRGGFVYNFWQDEKNERGLWRRVKYDDYGSAKPKWETLLDLDKLAKEENENWVFKGAFCHPPEGERCILSLSRGGKDASVLREFDVPSKSFVKDGFYAPEAKWHAAWHDRDSLWIGTELGAGSMTKAGYPRQVRWWKRGQPLEQSKLVYEASVDDVSATGSTIFRPEGTYSFVTKSIDFYASQIFRVGADFKLEQIPVPADAELSEVFDGRMFFTLRTAWSTPRWQFPGGSLVAIPVADMKASPELAFAPTERVALQGTTATKSQLLLGVLDNVQQNMLRAVRGPKGWKTEALRPSKAGVSFEVSSTDPFEDRVLAYETGYLVPPTILSGNAAATHPSFRRLRSLPARFDAKGLVAEQREATSADGTKIPYFVVHPRAMKLDGSNPTLLYGYGGFQISMTPEYLGAVGKIWLEKRHAVYAVANIRGGGEFGPRWHMAARQENRQKAFDDFAAVAKALEDTKVASPKTLGIMGGSNGGLLVGASLIERPELFGAVVCQVPLLDMYRYHKLLAGFSWIAEYGNPDDPKIFEALSKYSPYQNVKSGVSYPKTLFLTSTKDDRVHPGHARKMTAKMEDFKQPVLLWENVEGGHGGAANIEQRVRFSALSWAFLWNALSGKNSTAN